MRGHQRPISYYTSMRKHRNQVFITDESKIFPAPNSLLAPSHILQNVAPSQFDTSAIPALASKNSFPQSHCREFPVATHFYPCSAHSLSSNSRRQIVILITILNDPSGPLADNPQILADNQRTIRRQLADISRHQRTISGQLADISGQLADNQRTIKGHQRTISGQLADLGDNYRTLVANQRTLATNQQSIRGHQRI